MIIRTPLRLSLAGGGSDLRYFYELNEGMSLGFPINYYNYIFFSKNNNGQSHIISDKENIETSDLKTIKDNLLRNILTEMKFNNQKIFIFSDLPYGTGLGSSSAMAVSLVNGLNIINNLKLTKDQIAEKAFIIEEKSSGSTIGKQDHYMSCFGKVNLFKYKKSSQTKIKNLNLSPQSISNLESHIVLIRIGGYRNATEILYDQKSNLTSDFFKNQQMNSLIAMIPSIIESLKKENYRELGKLISETWEIKKTFSKFISNLEIDELYTKLINLGVYGGKLLGAGSSGYFLAICNRKVKEKISNNFSSDRLLSIKVDLKGSISL